MEAILQNKLQQNELTAVSGPKDSTGPLNNPETNMPLSTTQAMELALSYLIANNIKPDMTLREYAKFTGTELRKIRSDALCNRLPLLKRSVSNRKEVRRINMVALYSIPFIQGFNVIEKHV